LDGMVPIRNKEKNQETRLVWGTNLESAKGGKKINAVDRGT